MLQAILSSHEHVIFMPPVHFSNLNVQCGTIIQLTLAGAAVGVLIPGMPIPGVVIPGIPIVLRSIIMALDISETPFRTGVLSRSNQSASLRGFPTASPGHLRAESFTPE